MNNQWDPTWDSDPMTEAEYTRMAQFVYFNYREAVQRMNHAGAKDETTFDQIRRFVETGELTTGIISLVVQMGIMANREIGRRIVRWVMACPAGEAEPTPAAGEQAGGGES